MVMYIKFKKSYKIFNMEIELIDAYYALPHSVMGYMYVVFDTTHRVRMAGTFRK